MTGSGQPLLQSESNKAKAHGYRGIGDGWGRSIGGGSGRKKIGDGPGVQRQGMGDVSGGGNLMGANPALGGYASIGRSMGLSVTSGRRPGAITSSGNVSFHSSGNAIDMSGPPASMRRFALYMAQHYGSQLEELIYSPLGWSIKNGQRTAPYAVAEHYNHVHVADTSPGGGGGGLAGGTARPVRARKSGLPGVTGAIADRAAQGYAAAVNQRLVGASTGGGVTGGAVGAPSGGVYSAGQLASLWTAAGGPAGAARMMAQIALRESGGNPNATHLNTNGTIDRGLWQINSIWGRWSRFGGLSNAQSAVHVYNTQGPSAWATYNPAIDRKYLGTGDGWGQQGGRSGTPGRRVSSGPRRPMSASRRSASSLRGAINVNFHGDIHVRSAADIDAIADAVGEKILTALGGTT